MHSNHCNFTSFISKKNCFRSCSIFSVPFWVSCLLSVLMEEIKHGTALFMCLIWGQGIHIAIVLSAPWLWRQIHLNRTGVIGRYQFLLISNLCQTLSWMLYRYFSSTPLKNSLKCISVSPFHRWSIKDHSNLSKLFCGKAGFEFIWFQSFFSFYHILLLFNYYKLLSAKVIERMR